MSEDKSTKEVLEYIEERAKNIERYSNKLSVSIEKLSRLAGNMAQKAGLEFTDNSQYYCDPDYDGGEYLGIRGDGTAWFLVTVYGNNDESWRELSLCSRKCKVGAVKRLPRFVIAYSKFLMSKEVEYLDAMEIAESLCLVWGTT